MRYDDISLLENIHTSRLAHTIHKQKQHKVFAFKVRVRCYEPLLAILRLIICNRCLNVYLISIVHIRTTIYAYL